MARSLSKGVQSFAVVSIFDRAIKALLLKEVQREKPSLQNTLLNPLIEEAVYSVVLLSQNRWLSILRLPAALVTGTTAARSLTGRVTPEQNRQGLTLDTKIGFLWSISRELLLWTAPISISTALNVADSCVFALSEVCPKTGLPEIPKFSAEWNYKVLSSGAFRFAANTVAQTHGIVASFAQHILFNLSSALSYKKPLEIPVH